MAIMYTLLAMSIALGAEDGRLLLYCAYDGSADATYVAEVARLRARRPYGSKPSEFLRIRLQFRRRIVSQIRKRTSGTGLALKRHFTPNQFVGRAI